MDEFHTVSGRCDSVLSSRLNVFLDRIWRLTLGRWKRLLPFILANDYFSDYLFYMPSSRRSDPQVKAILLPHAAKALEPGLPRKNICASDHVLLGVEMEI